MKVDGSLKSLIQGVSQQPPRNRLPGQCTLQENMSSNPVDGLLRRPPLDFINDLFSASDDVQFYDLNFGGDDKYVLAAGPGFVRCFDLEGVEHNVSDSSIETDTSTSSVAIATGAKTFTVSANKTFATGQWVRVVSAANNLNFMYGTVTSYSGTTLVLNVLRIGGSGTHTDWNISTSSFSYIDGNDLAFTTIDDQTFIANKTIVPAMLPDFSPVQDYNSIFFLLGGQYGTKYTVTVNWRETSPAGTARSISVNYTTPDGGTSSDSENITTEYIATQLVTALQAVTTNGFNTAFTITQIAGGDHAYIKWAGGRTDAFEVIVTDGAGQTGIFSCNNLVTDISKLPKFAPQGYIVDVQGDPNSVNDDYYLKFEIAPDAGGTAPALGAGFGQNGIWKETVKNKIPYLLDVKTMPHVLTYDFDTLTFTFGQGTWKGRQVGDLESNEDPTFIGNPINDLFYFQSRLGILAGPAAILSITNTPDDFWIKSATQDVETDAIDIESTAKGVTKMLRAVPNNRDLVVFSDGGQFIIFGRTSLTPQNASLVLTTNFEAELAAAPVSTGRNVNFAINYGKFTGIREFYTDGSQDINDSRPITQHVLKYIEGKVMHMAATTNFDLLLVKASANEKLIYAYEYIWQDDKKVQSSWSKWILPATASYFFFVESVIYFIQKNGNNYTLESLDLDTQPDDGLLYQAKIDRKIYIDGVHTEIDSLYVDMPADMSQLVLIQGEGCPHPGLRAFVDDYDAGTNTITLKKNMGGGTVIAGLRYLSRYQPTMPFAKDADGIKIGTGNLIVSKFYAQTKETGDFYSKVFGPYREDQVIRFSGYVVGNPDTLIGEAPISDLTQTIPFRDNTDNGELEFYTDSHLPFGLSTIEWIGQYTKQGKRVTSSGGEE